ncbi:DUF222 domain-containing protein [Kribbella speibonae]|uniref:DUF222 domain-containing protein n=1 Tax=Kribbella speibonae TaxID=1572660 RepID=A0A4R0IHQ1_9ACTN|nr:hypothetical protein [Kribbella speibonae]TCC31670.1 hypothetical protein E0H92_34535 [Kribbella speibonae]
MFEQDLDMLTTRDLLEQAADCRTVANLADARLLECAQTYADRFHPSICPTRPTRRAHDGRERAVILGGDGCPEIAEFAIAEFAVVLGVSPGVGRDLLADALALRHRFPRTWSRIQAGEATPWKARQIVRACSKLDHAAAEYVDRRVAAIIDTIPPHRLEKIARAARQQADPAAAADEAAAAADDRGVHIGRGDGHGNKTIYIKAAAAAVNRCNATITDIAEALKTFGDTRPVQHRRADAIEILADPRYTQELLNQARNHPHPNPTAPPTSPTTLEPNTNEPRTPTTSDNPAAAHNAAPQYDEVAQDEVAQGNDLPLQDDIAQDDVEVRNDPPVQDDAVVQDDMAMWNHPVAQDDAVQDGVHDDSVAQDGVVVRNDPMTQEDVEPVGPPDDPWLEAAAPYDPDPPTDPFDRRTSPDPTDPRTEPDQGSAMDAAARRALRARLAQIKQDAYATPSYPIHPASPPAVSAACLGTPILDSSGDSGRSGDPAGSGEGACSDVPVRPGDEDRGQVRPDSGRVGRVRAGQVRPGQVRPGQTEVVVHLTDYTLATGSGVLRAEDIGPLLAAQLGELVGYGPYTVKPVIDLNDAVSVDAYEIPTRIRDRVRFTHPVELFPYGTRETTNTIDLDHIKTYDPHGPSGQTSTTNLAPLGRFGHRVKTHARGWSVRRIDHRTLEWRTPHGFTFQVDPNGTHRTDP